MAKRGDKVSCGKHGVKLLTKEVLPARKPMQTKGLHQIHYSLYSLVFTLYDLSMRRQLTTSSYSMPRVLHRRLSERLPMHGDRSKLIARMIEMWLAGDLQITNLTLRSRSVANNNTTTLVPLAPSPNCQLT